MFASLQEMVSDDREQVPRCATRYQEVRLDRFIVLVFGVLLTFLLTVKVDAQEVAPTPPVTATQPAAAPEAPAEKPSKSFFQILFSGGPVGVIIMLVLIGLSLTAAYLVFDNLMILRRSELIPDGLGEETRALVGSGRLSEAAELCRKRPSLLAFVMLYGLAEAEGGYSEVEKAMEDATAEQSARLFRKVEYLSVVGNIAPMVGLLGTVTGMLLAFKEVADSEGNAGAAQLADGIYQALVTTVVGLIIAIPSLGAFAIFRNRVDQFIAEAAYAAQHAVSPLKRRSASVVPPPPPPPPPANSPGKTARS
nr:MotA/TolQ/ExbB proton channel family protein [Pirellula staleyi]